MTENIFCCKYAKGFIDTTVVDSKDIYSYNHLLSLLGACDRKCLNQTV